MSLKILKVDIIASYKKHVNEENIEDVIEHLRNKLRINLNVKLISKGYKCFESFISYEDRRFKGYGRTKYEALFNCLIESIENLLDFKIFIEPIKDGLKELHLIDNRYKHKKDSGSYNIITNDNEESETKVLMSMLTNDRNLVLSHEEDFSINSSVSFQLKEELSLLKYERNEKILIFNELEKLIHDMQTQIKTISELIKLDFESLPDYFKCPISWEKLSDPVITNEGHSYERWAIEKWLVRQDTSPITGLKLTDYSVLPNYALKSAVDDYVKKCKKWSLIKDQLLKFVTKSDFDMNDLKKYFYKELM